MKSGARLRNTVRCLGVTAAGAALVVGLTGSAHAGGGKFLAITQDYCGSAKGLYHYIADGQAKGKTYYDTWWDFDVFDHCKDGKGVSLYTKYNKWNGTQWVPKTDTFHRIGAYGEGNNVADVRIFVCLVGSARSCGEIVADHN
ncbi:hypothetical protein AB0B50_38980 [Streptomyces sp. NPDC041068]|uniref:hypothetical protein n=1 Tax=Streptomyces sp. NPDC041068 TaxID=3155130 RepID=UPI0033C7502B